MSRTEEVQLSVIKGETQALRAADIKLKGSEVLQHRATRRIQRARHAGQLLEERLAEERSKAENEKVLAIAQEKASSSEVIVRKDQSLAAKDAELDLAKEDAARLKRRLRLLWRSVVSVVVLLVAAAVVILLWRRGELDEGNGNDSRRCWPRSCRNRRRAVRTREQTLGLDRMAGGLDRRARPRESSHPMTGTGCP